VAGARYVEADGFRSTVGLGVVRWLLNSVGKKYTIKDAAEQVRLGLVLQNHRVCGMRICGAVSFRLEFDMGAEGGLKNAIMGVELSAPSRKGKKSMTRRSGQSGYVMRKGRMWHGRFWEDVAGQDARVRRSVPLGLCKVMSKSEARRKLRSMLEDAGVNTEAVFVRTVKPGPTFADQAAWWEVNRLRLCALSFQESRGVYLRSHLLPYFGTSPVCAIGETEAQEFITHLSTRCKLSSSTVSSIIQTLKAILGKHVTRDWGLRMPKSSAGERRYFTHAEMLAIVDGAKGKWKAFFALLAETGLRFGEGAGLHVDDLDLAACRLCVRRSIYQGAEVPVKTRAGLRTIDLSPGVVQVLRDHLAGKTTGRVFETRTGRPLAKDAVRHSLHRILDKLKIARGGLHSFRHGRVALLQAAGVPADLIRSWVGHATNRVTSLYAHFGETYRQAEAQRVGLFAGAPGPGGPKSVSLDPSFPAVIDKDKSLQGIMNKGLAMVGPWGLEPQTSTVSR